jgi:hypothetical protein
VKPGDQNAAVATLKGLNVNNRIPIKKAANTAKINISNKIETDHPEHKLEMAFSAADFLRKVDKIKHTIWRSYFSFIRGTKSANSPAI